MKQKHKWMIHIQVPFDPEGENLEWVKVPPFDENIDVMCGNCGMRYINAYDYPCPGGRK